MNIFDNLPGRNGAHWGLTDIYPDKLDALKRALAGDLDFTTGWYSSKKEIASANITRVDGIVEIAVSVTDDFDTEGFASIETASSTWEEIAPLIDKAWQAAENNRKENEEYRGFKILRDGAWVWNYIQNISDYDYDSPPGDYYLEWGFNYGGIDPDSDAMTDSEREQIENWINDYPADDAVLTVGKFTVKPWE